MVVLGSGSAGNATVVTDGTTTVLIDCGFSAADTARRLRGTGVEPSSVAAILVTHEHTDHVRGIEVFCRRHAPDIVVYATMRTLGARYLREVEAPQMEIRAGEVVGVGTLEVLPFHTSHDAAEPVGYRVSASDGRSIGVATDTGEITPQAREALEGCAVLGIECNHDVRMLENGPYPSFLKRRILSAAGHLSNDAAADALEVLAHDELEAVVAMHRSRTNNTLALAADALEQRLARIGLGNVTVRVAAQSEACE